MHDHDVVWIVIVVGGAGRSGGVPALQLHNARRKLRAKPRMVLLLPSSRHHSLAFPETEGLAMTP